MRNFQDRLLALLCAALVAAVATASPCKADGFCGHGVSVLSWVPHQVVTVMVDGLPMRIIVAQGVPPSFTYHKCECVENDEEEWADDDCIYDPIEVPTDPGGTHTDVGCNFANQNYSESCQLASVHGCEE